MATAKQIAANLAQKERAKKQGLGKKSKGAPLGNDHKSRGHSIQEAIHYVLTTYERGDVQRGQALKAIVERAVDDAINGDRAARDWISERAEGKAVSITETTVRGDPERPLGIRVLFGSD